MSRNTLETDRLLLRLPQESDASTIASLIGEYDVCKNLGTVPYPYAQSDALSWVSGLGERRASGVSYQFGVTRKSDGVYMGGCGLHLKDGSFELGYWYGKPYWKAGYATEAARRVMAFAFDDLNADSVWAGWYADNPASGHVLAKVGFEPNGREMRACMARKVDVDCNLVILSRVAFMQGRVS